MISDYKNGGLRMIDIKSFNKALESTWVKKYLHDLRGDAIFKGNLPKNHLAKFIHISDAFITELLKIWPEISYDGNITSSENLLSLPLWQHFQDLGHSFSLYGPPSRQITYMYVCLRFHFIVRKYLRN